ncbi:MAG: Transcriptional repressor NrdR [Chlamydiae bacterium]|nr:Transcriptional repressor NrdR [Chlamydiota bacterium]
MKCVYCGSEELKVTDSRAVTDLNAIKRRRECLQCNERFTTFETVDLIIQVLKRDGFYEEYMIQKLTNGLDAACHHTTISHSEVRQIAEEITMGLMYQQMKEISTKELGEIVMQKLLERDPIAYIRFACVYRRFKDLTELIGAINAIKSKDEEKSMVQKGE